MVYCNIQDGETGQQCETVRKVKAVFHDFFARLIKLLCVPFSSVTSCRLVVLFFGIDMRRSILLIHFVRLLPPNRLMNNSFDSRFFSYHILLFILSSLSFLSLITTLINARII